MPNARPTIERLHELFSYDPETGKLIRKIRVANQHPGTEAGGFSLGYRRVSIDGAHYMVHVVIWAMVTGEWPADQIDHWDRARSNNRFGNLREATEFQQRGNTAKYKNNRSGFKGVFFHKQSQKWQAMIRKDRRGYHLGLFSEREDAALAYNFAAAGIFGEFANLNAVA